MSNTIAKIVRREIDSARNRSGMQAGLPKVTIEASHAEYLCRMAEHIAELELREREWQPIETAPKDGSWFLATWKFRDFFKCRHVTAEILASENGGLPSDWVDECWDDGDDEVDPTHWMPLREPSRALDAQENSDE